MSFNYGVMQGRLSTVVNNKIQAFPEKYWKTEFSKAKKLGLKSIEWTLDYKNLHKNPIFSKKGQIIIKKLSKKYSVKINSLTGDCFMQKPFWKNKNNKKLIDDLKKIIDSCKKLGIKFIVIPLVDNGSINNNNDRLIRLILPHHLSILNLIDSLGNRFKIIFVIKNQAGNVNTV